MKAAKGKVSPELEEKIIKYFDDAQGQAGETRESNFGSDHTYQRIEASISRKEKSFLIRTWPYQAAAAALLISLISIFYQHSGNDQNQLAMQEKKVATGSLSRIELPDGTEIWLNAGSKIRFPDQFAEDKREVTLEGEAFFNVKHEEKRPFLIHTQDMITQVLGTSFNISSYPQEQQIKVTVLSGKVAVYEQAKPGQVNAAQPLFLTANQQGLYSKTRRSLTLNKKAVKSAEAVAWKEGNLIFKDTELREVVQRLERRYAVQIEMDTSLRCPVTVNFNNEPLERVMRVLAQLVDGQMAYKAGHYQLTGVVCQ